MTPQAYNAIRYDEKQSLWNNIEGRQLDAQFFHMGMGFRRRVRMFSLDQTTSQAREIHFRPELFSYGDTGVDTRQLEGQSDLGFAGFRVFKAPELARRDIVSFLGASYFRAVDEYLPVRPLRAWSGGGYLYRHPGRVPRISPPSGLKPSSRATPPLPSMRCWTARALPVPISS